MTANISWKLRMEHKGFSHIWLSWRKGNIHFDPTESPSEEDIVVLLWTWPERIMQTAKEIASGKKLVVIAAQEVLDWLRSFGSFDGYADRYEKNGLSIQLTPYESFPAWIFPETLERFRALFRHPKTSLSRLVQKRKTPHSMPRVAEVTFPSGAKLVHLNLSLHRKQQESWLQAYAKKCGSVNWMITGIDYNQTESFVQNLSFFNSPLILVADLLSDSRKTLGLPTQWLTPVVDRLLDIFQTQQSEQQAFVFAPHASFRFENTELLAKQENL